MGKEPVVHLRRYNLVWGALVLAVLLTWQLPHAIAQQVTREVIGYSEQGREIEVYRFGSGVRTLVVVGATHGAPERNTAVLSRQLIDWFRNHPEDVPADVTLYIVPLLNPDGDVLEVRQNARGVDLNRNMNTNLDACPENDWSQQVFGAYGTISFTGGDYADSEVESRVIRDFLLDKSAVIFLHSAAGLVFPSYCEDPVAIAMAQTYARAADYTYARYWEAYDITGGMHDWARGIELPAIIPELESGDDPEFERNLAGLKAVMADATELVPLVELKEVSDTVTMPLPIWRFWVAHGGAETLGEPVGPTRQQADGAFVQSFTTIRVRYQPQAMVSSVQALPLELPVLRGEKAETIDPTSTMTFADTMYVAHDAIARYYQRFDGDTLLGPPVSNETLVRSGATVEATQYFQFGVVRYDESINRIVRAPVVWQQEVVANLVAPTQPFQIR